MGEMLEEPSGGQTPPSPEEGCEASDKIGQSENQERRENQEEEESAMAFPTAVNGQITDAVTQANVSVLGDAPAQAMGMLLVSVAQAQSLAAANAVAAQQQGYILGQAVTTSCVRALLGIAP